MNCSKNFFRQLANDQQDGLSNFTQILEWSNGSGSDLFAMLNAYNVWQKLHNEKAFGSDNTHEAYKRMKHAEELWATRYCLNIGALHECQQQIVEIENRLQHLGIHGHGSRWNDDEKAIMLKVVIAGSFYPNLFGRIATQDDDHERGLYHMISGKDVRNTVYFCGFEQKYLRQLYTEPIKDLFVANGVISDDQRSDIRVSFDVGSQKVFVTFLTDDDQTGQDGRVIRIPGRIHTNVYRSIKLRQLRIPMQLSVIGYAYTHTTHWRILPLINSENSL